MPLLHRRTLSRLTVPETWQCVLQESCLRPGTSSRPAILRFPFSGFVAAGPIATSRWRLQQEIYSLTKRKKVIGLSPPVRPWSRLSICHPWTSEQDQISLPLLKSPYPATRTKTFLFNPQYRKRNQAFTTPLSASHQPAQPNKGRLLV